MRMSSLLVLLIAIAVGGGAAWWLLASGDSAGGELDEEDPLTESLPERPGGPGVDPPVVVPLPPPEAEARVRVVDRSDGVYSLPREGAETVDALHQTWVGGDLQALDGQALIREVAKVIPLRFREQADLEALRRVSPDPDWPEDEPILLFLVVERWQHSGFDIQRRGDVLLISREGG